MLIPNETLTQARNARGWTLVQAALRVGVGVSTYGGWERAITEPSLANLRALCAAFEMTPEQLGYVIYTPAAEQEPLQGR